MNWVQICSRDFWKPFFWAHTHPMFWSNNANKPPTDSSALRCFQSLFLWNHLFPQLLPSLTNNVWVADLLVLSWDWNLHQCNVISKFDWNHYFWIIITFLAYDENYNINMLCWQLYIIHHWIETTFGRNGFLILDYVDGGRVQQKEYVSHGFGLVVVGDLAILGKMEFLKGDPRTWVMFEREDAMDLEQVQ